MRHECGKRETEGAKISQSRTTNEHQIEELEGINQESKRLCKRLSDDFRTLDSPIEGRQMVTTIVESICAKSKCSFHFVHRALELARRRGEIIDDTDEERLEWRETEGKQRLTGKVWSFCSKLEKFEASKNKLLKLCDLWCLAARPQDPQGESILGVFGSEAGKYPKLDERRQRSFVQGTASVFLYGFLRFSVNLLWRKLFFRSGRKQLGGPGADLRQICTWALLGFCASRASRGSAQAAPRSGAPNRNQRTRSGTRHPPMDSHMDYMPYTCCYMLLISCLILSEAILISRTWGHLEASSNSIYVCFRFCQSSPKTFDRYKMASGGGLWKIQRFAKNLVGLKTDLKHIEIDWLESCQYLVTLPKGLEYDCRGIKVFLGSTASIEEKPVWVMVPYQVQRRRWTM